MASWNSIEWENKGDFDSQDFSRLERYFKSDPNITLVNRHIMEREVLGESGSIIGGGARTSDLIKETIVYHKDNSTLLLERMVPNLTKLKVFSPSRNMAGKVLEEILRYIKLY